jgi:hypothetical protein
VHCSKYSKPGRWALATLIRMPNLQHHPRHLITITFLTGVIFLSLLLLAAPDSTPAPHYTHSGRKEKPKTTKDICLPSGTGARIATRDNVVASTTKDFCDVTSFVGVLRLESPIFSLTKQLLGRKEYSETVYTTCYLGPPNARVYTAEYRY